MMLAIRDWFGFYITPIVAFLRVYIGLLYKYAFPYDIFDLHLYSGFIQYPKQIIVILASYLGDLLTVLLVCCIQTSSFAILEGN